MSTSANTLAPLAYVLQLADTALVLGQRNAEWCGHGPALEEDIALANNSLDLIGQARMLYSLAALQAVPQASVALHRPVLHQLADAQLLLHFRGHGALNRGCGNDRSGAS